VADDRLQGLKLRNLGQAIFLFLSKPETLNLKHQTKNQQLVTEEPATNLTTKQWISVQ